ncbi:Uma2 family endonuclease [Lentzea sp. E54]|uniref:Uma2 family endonuclease n=1 Tax=Lentzea xerophila TaxID=3435883 RepID=UPI003DA693A2
MEVEQKSSEAMPLPFDPLVDLRGIWTTELASRYLPIPGTPRVKYECLDGFLVTNPFEGSPNGFGMLRLAMLIDGPAMSAGRRVYPTVNVGFGPQRWIQPDLTVLKQPIEDLTWIPADLVLMPVEFVLASSRRRDRIDKPAECARAGIPYFMSVEFAKTERTVKIELSQLDGDRYKPLATGFSGQKFETDVPFPMSFDPAQLLESWYA